MPRPLQSSENAQPHRDTFTPSAAKLHTELQTREPSLKRVQSALTVLSESSDERAVPLLLHTAKRENLTHLPRTYADKIQTAALQALAQTGHPDAVRHLFDVSFQMPGGNVAANRATIAATKGLQRDRPATKAVLHVVLHRDRDQLTTRVNPVTAARVMHQAYTVDEIAQELLTWPGRPHYLTDQAFNELVKDIEFSLEHAPALARHVGAHSRATRELIRLSQLTRFTTTRENVHRSRVLQRLQPLLKAALIPSLNGSADQARAHYALHELDLAFAGKLQDPATRHRFNRMVEDNTILWKARNPNANPPELTAQNLVKQLDAHEALMPFLRKRLFKDDELAPTVTPDAFANAYREGLNPKTLRSWKRNARALTLFLKQTTDAIQHGRTK